MIEIAISPCPNDTFLFDGLKSSYNLVLADIQQLNLWAMEGKYPIIKMSAVTFAKVTDRYRLLPVGAAIGPFGPKLIAKTAFDLNELPNKRVAVPGSLTTANLLFSTLVPKPKEAVFCRYDEVPHLLAKGVVDAGVIIHETRFTFQEMGFVELADLGALFYNRFQLPVPLGVIAAKKELPQDLLEKLVKDMRASLKQGSITDFVLASSQEKERAIIEEHIKTYVTKETEEISNVGKEALHALFILGVEQALLPPACLKNFNTETQRHRDTES